jgi:hypothetical protein
MARADSRRVMSIAEFNAIPVDDKYPIDGYYKILIDENERIPNAVLENPRRLKEELTAGQRMLIEVATFDSQVKNGGITQYFWNCVGSIFEVGDWIEQLGVSELRVNYDRALESLVGKKDKWLALREEMNMARDNPQWETFQQSYDLLDLSWFDDAYFDKYDYDENKEWVRKSRGIHYTLLTRLAEYIRTHAEEFITE